MGIFTTLMNKIFHSSSEAPVQSAPEARTADARPVESGGGPATAAPRIEAVDVSAILDRMATENKQKLDWRHSIVDLMKLVGIDSSLSARRELAADLQYTGDIGDTAAMNIWLHKEVMKKLAENGGTVPQELLRAS
jgi:Domain of unknown function (DUF3597)